jgi:protein-disulfide isomerase
MRTPILCSTVVTACSLLATAVAAEPLATVGDRKIERAEVEKAVAGQLVAIENNRYKALREGLDAMVAETLMELEAEARGVSVQDLANAEIFAKAGEPTDDEVKALYEQHKANLKGAPLEEMRPRLVDYLKQGKLAAQQEALLTSLRAKYPTAIALRPPTVKVDVGSRVKGPANAPVTIVEFSDYECPFCKRAEPSIKQVLDTYGDKVRLAYRDYPLDFHANARPASLAAHCANAQGKFWEYHEKVMASEDLSKTALEKIADDSGLDRAAFDACFAKDEFKAAIDADMAAGAAAGVNGTPAFFINGRMLDGAQPFEAFKEIIDEELAWQQGKKKPTN